MGARGSALADMARHPIRTAEGAWASCMSAKARCAGGATFGVAAGLATGGASRLALAGRVGAAANGVSKFGSLSHFSAGIAPFSTQRAITAGQRGAIQAHHLIERRFANVMGGSTDDWATIVVTRSEHQVFTNAWRQAIPYGQDGTGMATRAQVEGAARNIYRDYPEILQALGLG